MESNACAADSVRERTAEISACEKRGQWQQALTIMAELRSTGFPPSVNTYGASLRAADLGNQWQHALQLLAEMRSHGLRPSGGNCDIGINACEKGGIWQDALATLAASFAADKQRPSLQREEPVRNALRREAPEFYPNAVGAAQLDLAEWQLSLGIWKQMREKL